MGICLYLKAQSSLHAVFHPRAVFVAGKQPQPLKFQYKAADRRVGGLAEIFFQLLGRKFTVTVGREYKLP